MLGEEIFGDNSVWITKTHFPIDRESQEWTADKIIYITRNPLDTFPSQASLFFTTTHTREPKKPWNEYLIWPRFIGYYAPKFAAFHARILE